MEEVHGSTTESTHTAIPTLGVLSDGTHTACLEGQPTPVTVLLLPALFASVCLGGTAALPIEIYGGSDAARPLEASRPRFFLPLFSPLAVGENPTKTHFSIFLLHTNPTQGNPHFQTREVTVTASDSKRLRPPFSGVFPLKGGRPSFPPVER